MEQIFGYIEKIVFQNNENGFTVARFKKYDSNNEITITGSLYIASPGEKLRIIGKWNSNSHGSQFEVSELYTEPPETLDSLYKYLVSKMIKGIGPKTAEKLISIYGMKTLDILENHVDVLSKSPGFSAKKAHSVNKQILDQKNLRSTVMFLQNYGVALHFAHKIHKKYNVDAISKIQNDPFLLAREIGGIGFKTADTIATRMGLPKHSHQRIKAAIEFVLFEMAENGNTCCELIILNKAVIDLLNIDIIDESKIINVDVVEVQIKELITDNRIIVNTKAGIETVWLKTLMLKELGVASHLNRIVSNKSKLREIDKDKALKWVEERLSINLADNQKIAIDTSISHKVKIITGGPGTGKSTITKAILKIFEKLTRNIILAAPTGKAAKRMSEITGKKANTIHSLLQWDFAAKSFNKNQNSPLTCDLIIIDEASMIDTSLMYYLLRAIPNYSHVIFIGDIFQLPSIGPGNVLKDFILSEAIHVTELNEIFRQAQDSKIIINAHKVNKGEFPDLNQDKYMSDFVFIKKDTSEETVDTIVKLISESIPKKYKIPQEDIQVLSPIKKGVGGIININNAIQKAINPSTSTIMSGEYKYAVDDRVMQIKNNYKKEIYNGDVGYISDIDFAEKLVVVDFDDKSVPYTFNELNELTLSYATSVHKYQGSESPCIIVPVLTSHFMMLYRNLLYTAITRGKRLVVLVGSGKAIGISVSRNIIQNRNTGLKEAILEIMKPITI